MEARKWAVLFVYLVHMMLAGMMKETKGGRTKRRSRIYHMGNDIRSPPLSYFTAAAAVVVVVVGTMRKTGRRDKKTKRSRNTTNPT